MDDVFEGKPDGRQSADVNHKVSRFRPTYKALTDEQKTLHDELKTKAVELENLYLKVLEGKGVSSTRYSALALTDLESSIMWIVKELTS